ncbi:Zinc finger protein [Armadillidium nasatum]|uniref:Zinc finger protein n=1 Tax=Armadillidium nasatum TaxID=96803 RepID=A0A5N5TNF1_9CRUS|nr:Zinc finger protein [Armadillidium nasatum]
MSYFVERLIIIHSGCAEIINARTIKALSILELNNDEAWQVDYAEREEGGQSIELQGNNCLKGNRRLLVCPYCPYQTAVCSILGLANLDIVLQILVLNDGEDWQVDEVVMKERGHGSNYIKGSRRLLTCSYCPYRTLCGTNLKHHTRFKHTKEKPFQCYVCSKGFTFKTNLNAHMRIHTGEKPYRCDKCNTRFAQKIHLRRHNFANLDIVLQIFGLNNDEDWWQNDGIVREERVCGMKPQENSYMNYNQRLLSCSYCSYRTIIGTNLKHHIRFKHTKEKPFSCSICLKKFSKKTNLNAHMRIHTGEKPYQCDKCNMRFSQKIILEKHQMRKKNIVLQILLLNDFENWQIDEVVREEGGQGWESHGSNYLKGSQRLFTCSYCPYRTIYGTTFKRHIMFKHTKEKPFQCSVCSKRFSMKTNLNIHMRIHTGEKPYQCDKCNMRFTKKSTLNKHQRRKKKSGRLLTCSYCPYRTIYETTLKRHIFTFDDDQDWHIGEVVSEEGRQKGNYLKESGRLLTCSYCLYRTFNGTNLKHHIMFKHTKEKPFQCSVCSKGFSMKADLNIHMRIHTGEKPYQCDKCNRRFSHKSTLKRHQWRKKGCGN